MKKILFLLFIQFCTLFAQGTHYLLPDIAAPGMSTYIELIRTNNEKLANLDGFYDNKNSGSFKLEPLNPTDTSKISFGAIIISWDGRLVSSQVFVHPQVKPNSTDWNKLNPEFRIPIVFSNKGTILNIDTLFLVLPYKFGDISGLPDRIFGEGSLGIRSKRGAMIVDSLVLANATYTVSVKDCDPIAEGNQGYLPFVLLSKGKIQGGANTILSVDGGLNGNSANGGPGGGGGGGKYCDLNASGSDGGNGFTGGGPGGTNLFNNSLSYRKSVGTGTGKNQTIIDDKGSKLVGGASLNGIIGGKSSNNIYESSGGGTGHPFGESGKDCDPNTDCNNNPGKFGAGSGESQDRNGGSGGYGSAGYGSDNNAVNGGKIHGNAMGIPLAGGSGGASGNPKYTFGGCAGEGGGGGGALRVYAKQIINVIFSANGNNGGNVGKTDQGGGGSGGFIDINSKMSQTGVIGRVKGGSRAGYGWIRFNNPDFDKNYEPVTANPYLGPINDTTEYIERISQINGTFAQGTSPKVFLKKENQPWNEISSDLTIIGNKWTYKFDIRNRDTLFYISAFQQEAKLYINDYLYTPQHIFSQGSFNILRKIKSPIIDGDSVINETIQACPNEQIIRSFKIYNRGDSLLYWDWTNAYLKDNNNRKYFNFSYTADRVLSGDSMKVDLWFKVPQSMTISDTLFVPHNDKFADHKPWAIAINITFEVPEIEARDTLNKSDYDVILPKSLFMGNVCWGDTLKSKFRIYNTGKLPVSVQLESGAHAGFDFTFNGNNSIKPGEFANVDVLFKSNNVLFSDTAFLKKYYIYIAGCTNPIDSMMLYATMNRIVFIVEGSIDDHHDIDFGKIAINSTKKIKIHLENLGKLNLSNQVLKPLASFPFAIITNLVGKTFLYSEVDSLEFSFTPKDTLNYKDTLKILIFDGVCQKEYYFYLSGGALPVKRLSVWIDSVKSLPTNTDLRIPVYGKLENPKDSLKNEILYGKINFRKTLFEPSMNSEITILKDSVGEILRYLSFKIDKYEINSKDSLLFNFKGMALLGDTVKTDIKWNEIFFGDSSLSIINKNIDGWLEIFICRENGERLVKEGVPQKMFAFYKNNELNVGINVLAVGNYKLELYNLQGLGNELNKWEHFLNNSSEYKFNFDMSKFSNGYYFLKLSSPSGIITLPITLID